MPTIMRSIDQIMADAKRDMFFVQFGTSPFDHDRDHPSRKRHFDWFRAHGLRWETAAPRGWLEGDPGIFAVYFDGPDDPRVAQYAAEFEDGTGKSLSPDDYQMYVILYASWLEKGGRAARRTGSTRTTRPDARRGFARNRRSAIRPGMDDDDGLAAACARLARENGWPDGERERLIALLADEERRRALYDHPRRMEFVGRALAEMLGGLGSFDRTAASDPDEVEVRAVALMMAEGLAP